MGAMDMCMSGASTAQDRSDCKNTNAKDALATFLGKPASDVTDLELDQFLDKGAKAKVGNTMRTCMSAATTANARASCKSSSAKSSLATALGKDENEITDMDIEEFTMQAAQEEVQSKMKTCVDAATTSAERAACSESAGKTALAASLGMETGDVSDYELKKYQDHI